MESKVPALIGPVAIATAVSSVSSLSHSRLAEANLRDIQDGSRQRFELIVIDAQTTLDLVTCREVLEEIWYARSNIGGYVGSKA